MDFYSKQFQSRLFTFLKISIWEKNKKRSCGTFVTPQATFMPYWDKLNADFEREIEDVVSSRGN